MLPWPTDASLVHGQRLSQGLGGARENPGSWPGPAGLCGREMKGGSCRLQGPAALIHVALGGRGPGPRCVVS